MKKYIILVVSILLFLGQSSLFAEEFSWKDFVDGKCELRLINYDGSDFVMLCVSKEDTICLSDYSATLLYGDRITKEEDKKRESRSYCFYGGHKDEKKPTEPFKQLLKLYCVEESNSVEESVGLRCFLPEGMKVNVVNWPEAYYKDEQNGYCKSDKMFTLALIDKAYISKVFNDIAGSRNNPAPPAENLEITEKPKLNVWLILFGVVCLMLVALTMYISRLRKIVSNQEKRLLVKEGNACAPEELERDCKDKIVLDESAFREIISREISACINKSLPAQFEKIGESLNEMSEGVKQSNQDLMQAIKGLRDVTPTEQKDTEFRTRNVSYISKKFVLDENPQFAFFEIYSIKGEYYYTLPEERETRSSFIMYMAAYDSCVEADCTTQNPTIAVPVRDGHLFRTGDSFEVDKNCLLRVELREG